MGKRPSWLPGATGLYSRAMLRMPATMPSQRSGIPPQPRHGGLVRASGGLYFELVAKPYALTLHAYDRQTRIFQLSQARAEALISSDQGNQGVVFHPTNGAGLFARAEPPGQSDFRVFLTLYLPRHAATQLVFGPFAGAALSETGTTP